jgi:hypothetical protein
MKVKYYLYGMRNTKFSGTEYSKSTKDSILTTCTSSLCWGARWVMSETSVPILMIEEAKPSAQSKKIKHI